MLGSALLKLLCLTKWGCSPDFWLQIQDEHSSSKVRNLEAQGDLKISGATYMPGNVELKRVELHRRLMNSQETMIIWSNNSFHQKAQTDHYMVIDSKTIALIAENKPIKCICHQLVVCFSCLLKMLTIFSSPPVCVRMCTSFARPRQKKWAIARPSLWSRGNKPRFCFYNFTSSCIFLASMLNPKPSKVHNSWRIQIFGALVLTKNEKTWKNCLFLFFVFFP